MSMPSSVIRAMQYEPETQTLVIAFREGRGTYRYFDVAVEEWTAFRGSGAKGNYLNEVFKAKGYLFERVTGEVSWTEAEEFRWGEKG